MIRLWKMTPPFPLLPMLATLAVYEMGAIVLVALLLSGARKSSEPARSMGRSAGELRMDLEEGFQDEAEPEA